MNKTTKIILITIVSTLCVGGLGIYLGLQSFKIMEASELDKELMVGPVQLQPHFEGFTVDEKHLKYIKMQVMGDTTQVQLNHAGVYADRAYHISSMMQHAKQENAAKSSYKVAWQSTTMGFKIGNSELKVKEDNEFFKVGDQSRFGFIMKGEQVVGNLLVIRKGKNTVTFHCTGLAIEDVAILHELFDERVDRLGDHK